MALHAAKCSTGYMHSSKAGLLRLTLLCNDLEALLINATEVHGYPGRFQQDLWTLQEGANQSSRRVSTATSVIRAIRTTRKHPSQRCTRHEYQPVHECTGFKCL